MDALALRRTLACLMDQPTDAHDRDAEGFPKT